MQRWYTGLRSLLARAAVATAAAVALTVAICLAAVWPYLVDDLSLDRVVRVVALDWRDFGEGKAHERLLYELDNQGIGPQVGDADCVLQDGIERQVRCNWTAFINVPGADVNIPLSFGSLASIASDGDVR